MTYPNLRQIQFQGFRGLGADTTSLNLKNKNYLVIGGNGKGKSSIADGIELFFRGKVGHIDSDFEPLKNIYTKIAPKITLWPSHGDPSTVELKDSNLSWVPEDKGGFAGYPSAKSFILRRECLRDFIKAKPGERFKALMALLGMSELEDKKLVFEAAHNEAQDESRRVEQELKTALKQCGFGEENPPTSLAQALLVASQECVNNKLPKLKSIKDIPAQTQLIVKRLKGADQESLNKVSIALASLDRIFPLRYDEDLALLEEAHNSESILLKAAKDGKQAAIITEGIKFFEENPDATVCPLCSSTITPTTVLKALKNRDEALAQLRSATSNKKNIVKQVETDLLVALGSGEDVIKNCADFMSAKETTKWEEVNVAIKTLIDTDINDLLAEDKDAFVNLSLPCVALKDSIPLLRDKLLKEKQGLEKKLEADLVNLNVTLSVLSRQAPPIAQLEREYAQAQKTLKQADGIRKAFNRAYKKALNDSLSRFKDKVIAIYNHLHEGCGESPECRDIALTPSKASSWLLKLKIDFLGAIEASPELYLSEGHLDSLGLAIYLASVLEFNPKGTLLVLDDVVSSIDCEHQDRIAEYLVQEFSDYQILITTHDERWGGLILSKADAIGRKKEWRGEKFGAWTPVTGPMPSSVKSNWVHINSMLSEEQYKTLGGPLRIVTEGFMKRLILKHTMYLPYRIDNRYTVADLLNFSKPSSSNFFTKTLNKSRTDIKLQKATNFKELLLGALLTGNDKTPPKDSKGSEKLLMRVFGVDNLINELSHYSPSLHKVTLSAVRDFATALKTIEEHCVACRLCAGEV